MLTTERSIGAHNFANHFHTFENHPRATIPNHTIQYSGHSAPIMAKPLTHEHIWIITGPAGSGKTTVAAHLATQLNIPYLEGDDFHPPANKAKMADGHPLDDADRWDWLITVREEAVRRLDKCGSVIVTCSALKKKYRDVIRIAQLEHRSVQVHFVFLNVDEDTLRERVANRVGHYMKANMVHSQMVALEAPSPLKEKDVLVVDVRNDKEAVKREALEAMKATLQEYENLPAES